MSHAPGLARTLPVVGVGGAAGALSRYAVGLAAPSPWTTFVVNVVGCAVIGLLAGALTRRPGPWWLYPLVGTGFLGGFTTFSAFALDVTQGVGHDPGGSTALGLLTPLSCVAAAALAFALGQRSSSP